MRTVVSYTYSKALSDRIFVASGVRRTDCVFRLDAPQLTSAAREAALTAQVVASPYTTPVPLVAAQDFDAHRCNDLRHVGSMPEIYIRPPAVEAEPTVDQAIADTEAVLIAAAAAAPAVCERAELILQEHAAAAAAEREAKIAGWIAQPLSWWIKGNPGELEVNEYRLNTPNLSELRSMHPLLEARIAEAIAEAARLNEEYARKLEADTKLRRSLLVAIGTDDQLERWDAGVLPAPEFSKLVSDHLHASLADFARYVPLTEAEVPHDDHCDGECKFSSEKYEGALTAEQWQARKRISDAAKPLAEIEIREHRGYCVERHCDAGAAERLGLRVSIEFAGKKYAREYALD